MRILFAFLIAFFITQLGYSQTFSQVNAVLGRVIDARTFKPLPFATVYLNQTTIGTVTNDNGEFALSNIPPGRYDLVVSYVGYQPYQSKVIVKAGPATIVSIRLTASTTNLNEIMVRSKKDKDWAALYEKFRRQFFGISPYTTECRILNPWVLDFVEDKGILTATASLPLEIENLGLGYTITCHLKEFTASARFYKINGTYRFTKAQTMDTTLGALWETRRDDAYLGSVRHFLKTMIADSLGQEEYKLFDDLSKMPDEVVRNSSFIANLTAHTLQPFADTTAVMPSNTEGQYTIKLPWRVEVHYLRDPAPPKIYRSAPYAVSWIEVAEGSLEVNKDGTVINPDRMVVFGAMGDPRVAELLPIDFQLSANGVKALKKKKVHSKLAALLEKPYVMTDKPYYYPAEAIMFKTFFNYISPIYRDSLSHVMNVELIDQSGKVVQKKMFPVLGGMAVGDFTLPATTPPGDYTLRTYTRWMLNFDKQLISSKAIKVLPPDQLGKMNDFPPQTKQLTIVTEKDEFETREQISLVLEALNFYGNPVAADLAVSVTDIEQAAIPNNEKNILSQFPFTHEMLPDTSLKKPTHLIQYGIDFKGRMVKGRWNKITDGVLTVYQEDVDDVFAIATDETGNFHQQIQLMDSTTLLLQSRTLTGRRAKVLMEEIKEPVPPIELADALSLETYRPSDPSKYHATDLFSTAKMLEAVTIEAKKVDQVSPNKKHLMSDSHIDGDRLRSTNAPDLLTALRGRIPGLQVMYYSDVASGMVKKFICLPGVVSTKGMQECLVEVDGVVLNSVEADGSVAETLASMSVQDVESVDVLRFGMGAAYGARSANGVIIIRTRMGEKTPARRKVDRSKLQAVNLPGYATTEEFVSPDYSAHTSGDDRLDLRSTIYWNPFVITSIEEPIKVSFFAADVPTRYRIVVEGVTADGEAVRGEKIIVVRSKK